MTRFATARIAASALLIFVSAGLCSAEDEACVDRIFDLANISSMARDFPAPRYSLDPAGTVREGMTDEYGALDPQREERPRLLDAESVKTMVEESVEFFRNGGSAKSSLKLRNGRLYVTAPPSAVDEAAKIISFLEAEALRSVEVHAVMFSYTAEIQKACPPPSDGRCAVPAKFCESLTALLARDQSAVMERASTSALNGQKVSVASGRERSFLRDLDSESTDERAVLKPVMDTLREGLVVEARPRLGMGGMIRTEYFVNCSKYKENIFETGNPDMGSLDLPSIRFFRTAGTAVAENGGGVLLGPVPAALTSQTPKKEGSGGPEAGPPEPGIYILLRIAEARK